MIQTKPMAKNPGTSVKAPRSIFIPMVITRMYRNKLPILEAPAPSSSRALVNESAKPPSVATTMIQKKEESSIGLTLEHFQKPKGQPNLQLDVRLQLLQKQWQQSS